MRSSRIVPFVLVCLFATAALSCSEAAIAGPACTSKDRWSGDDKNAHALIGGIAGFAGTLGTGSVRTGLAIGVGIAAGKELLDAAGGGTCSFQDFAVTAIAAAVGASLGGWALSYRDGTTTVSYSAKF